MPRDACLNFPRVSPTSRGMVLIEVIAVVLVLGFVLGGGFHWLNLRNAALHEAGGTVWRPEIALDATIPLSPIWIWPYLAWYPLCFAPLVYAGRLSVFRRMSLAYVLTYGPCLIFYALVPSGIARPAFEITGPSTWALDILYQVDPGFNVFPSLHVATAILVALIFQRMRSRWAIPVWILAGLISMSTVFTKQHFIVDVPAGVLLGIVAFVLAFGIGLGPLNSYGGSPKDLDGS